MELVFQHAWILFIVATCANTASWWSRGKKEVATHPDLKNGYRTLVRGFVVFGNIPWIVMGFGIEYGGVPNVFHYFHPTNGPFVAAFWVTVVATWILLAYWILLGNGAESLIRYPGLLNARVRETWVVKAVTILALLGGVVGLAIMMTVDLPIPR